MNTNTKKQQLAKYASTLRDETPPKWIVRETRLDKYGECINCGENYLQFRGFVSAYEPYREAFYPVPCPTCFFNPEITEEYIGSFIYDFAKSIFAQGKLKVLPMDSSTKILKFILNSWPKSLEEIVKIQKEAKNG